MAKAVIMPKAGITVESCIIGEWHKKVGDSVAMGEVIFSYETDKATFDCESTEEGELLEIFFNEGDVVPCLENVCAIGAKGDDCSALRPAGAAEAEAAPAVSAAPAAAAAVEQTAATGKISPRARNLAEAAGVNANDASASGPDRRVIERDIRKLMAEGPAAAAQTVSAAAAVQAEPEYEDRKLPGIRKVISKTMMGSLHGMAQLTHNFSFDATAIKSFRAAMKQQEDERSGITIGDMILFAVSRTILEFPELNANMLDDTTLRCFSTVNLGVAVDTPRGLLVPVIRNADKKSLTEISLELKALAKEAISGAISPDKLSGASFTVSNLGSFGVESFTPIINPPQTGILGVCAIFEKPRTAKNGGIELYPSMNLSLTYDHRVLDGGPASRFMQKLCRNLEDFTSLLAK